MDTEDDELVSCMEGMADGDPAFLFTFHERFGEKIGWVVRDIVRGMGRLDILRNADEIDGLVIDACEVIFIRAAGWHPGGARPWNWAAKAIRSRIAAGIGHRLVEFDDRGDEAAATALAADSSGIEGEANGTQAGAADLTRDIGTYGSDPSTVTEMLSADPRAGLLDLAIRSVGRERNQIICWQYSIQKALGDPSPAVTVAGMFGLKPGNVRQIHHRQKAKVEALVQSDDQFESLREIVWFAA